MSKCVSSRSGGRSGCHPGNRPPGPPQLFSIPQVQESLLPPSVWSGQARSLRMRSHPSSLRVQPDSRIMPRSDMLGTIASSILRSPGSGRARALRRPTPRATAPIWPLCPQTKSPALSGKAGLSSYLSGLVPHHPAGPSVRATGRLARYFRSITVSSRAGSVRSIISADPVGGFTSTVNSSLVVSTVFVEAMPPVPPPSPVPSM